jgi:hypothetical protein
MILFGREVYIGYSMTDFSNARSALEQNNIKYKYRITNRGGSWLGHGTARGNFGSFGQNADVERQYSISVKSADYESASYFVNKALHG